MAVSAIPSFRRVLQLVAILMFVADRPLFFGEAKRQRGVLQIGTTAGATRWHYVSKFAFGIGKGQLDVRARLKKGSTQNTSGVKMEVYLDEDWPRVESVSPCSEARRKMSRLQLYLNISQELGEWGPTAGTPLSQNIRSHIWYFAVADCDGSLGDQAADLEYELHAVQHDGSEFGVEAQYMLVTESVAFFGFATLLLSVAYRCRKIRESVGLHPVMWALVGGATMQCASQVAHIVHLSRYSANGEGFWLLDVVAEFLFMGSQVVHAMLLIAIARGYTLLPGKSSTESAARLGFVATLAAHAALMCFGKLQEGTSSHRNHDNDGLSGWIVMLVRVLLLVFFLGSAKSTQLQAGSRLDDFMSKFQVAGALYFLAYPTVFLVTRIFAPYLQQPVSHVGLLFMQAAVDLWLAKLFLTRGAYFKVSTLSSSLLAFTSADFCKDD
eukprot:TRINITY_DN49625_c0_g1_i1.p1 TRINITY_DN49625_c0_g1~~TRINITY_DN49625_c0_g1_i1.p1  ORF type:complete len:457 (+),score=72.65 TRINITY_DN49625_c0_g1_i1:56-1372(+)